MIRLQMDEDKRPEPFTIYLAHHNHERIGQLINVDQSTVTFVGNLNSADEVSFTVHKYLDGVEEPLWDELYDLRYIYIPEINDKGEFFEIKVDSSETQKDDIKEITGTGAAESELSQIMLYDIEINTEDDIKTYITYNDDGSANTDKTAVFWKENEEGEPTSLLGRVMSMAPNWSVKYVDYSLIQEPKIYELSVDDKSLYDTLVSDIAQTFNCIFQFDSVDRTISVYDLYSVCENDDCSYFLEHGRRYRGAFSDKCPICGGKKIKYFGKDTTCFADVDNLTDEVQLTTDSENIKNTFKLKAGDDLMTATVKNINPNGSDRLYYFSKQTLHDMSDELRNKLESYEETYNAEISDYTTITENVYNSMTRINYLTSMMMPTVDTQGDVNAKTQAEKLNDATLSPVAVRFLSASTSQSQIESAIVNYAYVYVKRAYFDIKVTTSSWNFDSSTANASVKRGMWEGKLTIISREDVSDVTVDNRGTVTLTPGKNADVQQVELSIEVTSDYETMLEQEVAVTIGKVQQTLDKKGRIKQPGNIYDVLSYKMAVDSNGNPTETAKTEFSTFLKSYCLNRLQAFLDAIDGGMSCLMRFGAATPKDQLGNDVDGYKEVYLPLHAMYDLVVQELAIRQSEIDAENEKLDDFIKQRSAVQDKLDFKKYLGEDLYNEFLTYRRESTYENQNYNTDNSTNATDGTYDNGEIIRRAREYFEKAQKDIVKSGEYQFSISANLDDLLVIEGFEPLVESGNFELGNYIRVRVDDEIYRLRLIKYEFNFGSLEQLSTEFSDFTQTADGVNDIQSLLSKAEQMGKSYDNTQTQASKGEEAGYTLEEYRNMGLDAAFYNIMNNNNEEITMDNRGIVAKAYNDITDTYDPDQLRITHNILAFTDDNWKSVKLALGKFTYWDQDKNKHVGKYGLNADFVLAGFMAGSTMVAGDIYSFGHEGLNGFSSTAYQDRIKDTCIKEYTSDPDTYELTPTYATHTVNGQTTTEFDFPHMTHIDLDTGSFNFGHGTFWFDAPSRTLNLNNGTFNAAIINTGKLNSVYVYASHIYGGDIHGTYIYGSHYYGGDLHIGPISSMTKDGKYHFNVQSNGTLTIGDAPNTNSHWPTKYPFEVDPDGSMYATNGHFSGTLFGSHFRGGDIYIGNGFEDESTETPFHVNSDGEMWATNGHFKGIIEAAGIYIGRNSNSKSGYNFSVYKSGNAPSDYIGETDDGYLTSIYGRLSTFTYDDQQIQYHENDVNMGFGIVESLGDSSPGLTMTKTGVGTALMEPGEFMITTGDKSTGTRLHINVTDGGSEVEAENDGGIARPFTLITNGDMACGNIDGKASMVATRRWIKNKSGIKTTDPEYSTNDFTLATREWVRKKIKDDNDKDDNPDKDQYDIASKTWVKKLCLTDTWTKNDEVSAGNNKYKLATHNWVRHISMYDDSTRMDDKGGDYALATTDFVNTKINDVKKTYESKISDLNGQITDLKSENSSLSSQLSDAKNNRDYWQNRYYDLLNSQS